MSPELASNSANPDTVKAPPSVISPPELILRLPITPDVPSSVSFTSLISTVPPVSRKAPNSLGDKSVMLLAPVLIVALSVTLSVPVWVKLPATVRNKSSRIVLVDRLRAPVVKAPVISVTVSPKRLTDALKSLAVFRISISSAASNVTKPTPEVITPVPLPSVILPSEVIDSVCALVPAGSMVTVPSSVSVLLKNEIVVPFSDTAPT